MFVERVYISLTFVGSHVVPGSFGFGNLGFNLIWIVGSDEDEKCEMAECGGMVTRINMQEQGTDTSLKFDTRATPPCLLHVHAMAKVRAHRRANNVS